MSEFSHGEEAQTNIKCNRSPWGTGFYPVRSRDSISPLKSFDRDHFIRNSNVLVAGYFCNRRDTSASEGFSTRVSGTSESCHKQVFFVGIGSGISNGLSSSIRKR